MSVEAPIIDIVDRVLAAITDQKSLKWLRWGATLHDHTGHKSEVPDSRSRSTTVYRACLARVAELARQQDQDCNPYGDTKPFRIGDKLYQLSFVNTPDEQRLDLVYHPGDKIERLLIAVVEDTFVRFADEEIITSGTVVIPLNVARAPLTIVKPDGTELECKLVDFNRPHDVLFPVSPNGAWLVSGIAQEQIARGDWIYVPEEIAHGTPTT